MKVHAIILNICFVISAGCLGAGYILGGYWFILLVYLAMAIFWMLMKERSAVWPASSLLVVEVFLAAVGVVLNLSIYLMVLGSATALVWWDLTHFRHSMAGDPPLETDVPLEKYHLQSLGTAVFAGLLLAFISSFINLQFPFGVMVFLVLMAVGCLVSLRRIVD